MLCIPSNVSVSERIGVCPSQVSRLRLGRQCPSLETMVRIELAYAWPLSEQIEARRNKAYHVAFETILQKRLGSND